MKALILAAGFGLRLREVIHGRPKHLVMVNGKPFLRYVVELLKKRGVTEIVISVGYLARYIVDEFKRDPGSIAIRFSEDHRPLGTAGGLKRAQKYFNKDFLLINGDTYLDIDYLRLMTEHKQTGALMTLVGTTKKTKGSVIVVAGNSLVKEFYPTKEAEKIPIRHFRHAGVYAVSPKIFELIMANDKMSLEKELIPDLLNRQRIVRLFPIDKEFIDIDSPKELARAERLLGKN